jgi:hypothetical protein
MSWLHTNWPFMLVILRHLFKIFSRISSFTIDLHGLAAIFSRPFAITHNQFLTAQRKKDHFSDEIKKGLRKTVPNIYGC